MAERMDDAQLKAVVGAKITGSLGYMGSALSRERLKSQQYYDGEPFGDEQDGRSKVVSRDVAESVDSMMPALLKCFTATATLGTFEPRLPEHEEIAKQATDYVNWIFWTRNPGFLILHNWIKDALLKKLGTIKVWWDEQIENVKESYTGLTQLQLVMLSMDPEIEIVSVTPSGPDPVASDPAEAASPDDETGPDTPQQAPAQGSATPPLSAPAPAGGNAQPAAPAVPQSLFDVVCRRSKDSSRVRIMVVPPEEFLTDHRTITLKGAGFLCHRTKKTVSELIEMGYDRETVEGLGSEGGSGLDLDQEKIDRFRAEDAYPYRADNYVDPSMREITVNECFVKIDYDGDGIAELRKITLGGEAQFEILDNEEVDSHPFCTITPVPVPHKLYGLSIADQTSDIQEIKSALWRGTLNSIYLQNEPMMGALDGKVNLDDLLNRRAGGVVRLKSPDALVPIETLPVSDSAFQAIEYADSVREGRTGVQRFKSTLTKDSINPFADTATGVNAVEDASNDRLQLIARVFADTGVTDLLKRILELVCKHQKKAEVIRLRGKFVSMDPREWTTEMDFTHAVGLGTGDRDKQLMHAMGLGAIYQQIIPMQGGAHGPLVTFDNLYSWLGTIVEKSGLRDVEKYFTDPKTAPPAPTPPPDPKMIEAQAKVDAIKAQAQTDMEQAQQKAALDAKTQQDAMRADIEEQQARAASDAALAHAEMQSKLRIQANDAAHDMAIEDLKAKHAMELERMKAGVTLSIKRDEFEEKKRQGAYKPQHKGKK